jgi:hypothetical protein
VDQALNLPLVGHIEPLALGTPPGGADRRYGFLSPFQIAICDHNPGSPFGQVDADRPADPRTSAGNDGNSIVKSLHPLAFLDFSRHRRIGWSPSPLATVTFSFAQ